MRPAARFILPALINSSNLNGTAAILLSLGLGSPVGTLIFTTAVILGSINKYRGLKRQHSGEKPVQNRILAALEHPTLTAVILMTAAAMNFFDSLFHLVSGPETTRLYYSMATLAWGSGIMGDNALRMNDQSNFAEVKHRFYAPGFRGAFILATRNPSFYGMFCNIFFSAAATVQHGNPVTNTQWIVNGLVVAVSLAGLAYGLNKAKRLMVSSETVQTVNDGTINIINSLGTALLGVLSWTTGNHYAMAACLLFVTSSIKSLFETRSALKKEGAAARF